MVKCPKCGYENKEDVRFCRNCGWTLRVRQQVEAIKSVWETKPEKGRFRKFLSSFRGKPREIESQFIEPTPEPRSRNVRSYSGFPEVFRAEEEKKFINETRAKEIEGKSPEYKPPSAMENTELQRRKLEQELENLQLQKEVLQNQLAQRGAGGGGGTGGPSGGGGGEGGTTRGSRPTVIPGPQAESLAEKQEEELRKQTDERAKLKSQAKKSGLIGGAAAGSAGIITVVAYFVLNNWIALGVNLLPAPIGPLLNSLWWVAYLAIFLLSFAVLLQRKTPGEVLFSGVLIAVIIGLVFGWLVNIFTSFLGPFLGPGVYCTLSTLKAQQQGGAIPTDCLTQSKPTVQKTGSVNLLSVSLGQSGVPFPQPRQGATYQFPITISNPSEFDIGPVVIESGYMCGKVGGHSTCGGFNTIVVNGNTKNTFVPNYTMAGTSCISSSKCILGSGGPPLVVSLQGVCSNSVLTADLSKGLAYDPTKDCSMKISAKASDSTVPDNLVPFSASYVNLYTNVRYPFKTAGTNDYYIVLTHNDVPKSAPSCSGSGSRQLGEACTGAGPLNVIPYFSESYYSLDQQRALQEHKVTLVIALSNVGDGTVRLDSVKVARFITQESNQGLVPDGSPNCQIPGTKIQFDERVLVNDPFTQQGLAPIGDTAGTTDFTILKQESANIICNYKISNLQLTGPSLDVKVEAQVSYDYYETASKTDVYVCSSTSCNTA